MDKFVAIIAYITPYFLIPWTFKAGMGVFGALTGAVNDRSRGLFDRQRKKRADTRQELKQRALTGNRFKENSFMGRRGFNSRVQTGAIIAAGQAGINPVRMRSRADAFKTGAANNEWRELVEKSDAVKAVKDDDTLARATYHGRNRGDIEQILRQDNRFAAGGLELSRAVSQVEAAQNAGSKTGVKSAMAVALAASKTGYANHSEMYESILGAADGNRALEGSLLAAARSASAAERADLSIPGHTEQANAMDELRTTMGDPDSDQHAAAREAVNAEMESSAIHQGGAGAILSSKPAQSVERTMLRLGDHFDEAMRSGNVDDAIEYAAQITSFRQYMGGAPPAAKQHVAAMLDRVGVRLDAINPNTGQPYSTDEQLGQLVGAIDVGRSDRNISQEIRTRAGAYDAGGGTLSPEQIEAQRRAQQEQ